MTRQDSCVPTLYPSYNLECSRSFSCRYLQRRPGDDEEKSIPICINVFNHCVDFLTLIQTTVENLPVKPVILNSSPGLIIHSVAITVHMRMIESIKTWIGTFGKSVHSFAVTRETSTLNFRVFSVTVHVDCWKGLLLSSVLSTEGTPCMGYFLR